METNRIIIIDGNSLINRAYYAIQRPMMTKSGLYTHAVYGFLNMLNKVVKGQEPKYILVTFDRKAPTFRHIEYKEYKAGRKKMPMELAAQLPLLKEVLEAMNIKILEIDGFEADDIIGTASKKAEKEGLQPLIISGDRDELQLATEITKVMITKKGISEFELYDKQAMIDKYGFTPEQFIDYKGLMGDQSDNIPGLPGVGEKTAQKLILQFGNVENLLKNTEEISNAKLRTKIEENAQLAMMSKRLATICTEVPIDINFSECFMQKPDYEKLMELYHKLEFNSLIKKLSQEGVSVSIEQEGSNNLEKPALKEVHFIQTIDKKEDMEFIKKAFEKESTVYLKIFTDNNRREKPIVYGISLLTGDEFFYLCTEKEGILEAFIELLNTCSLKFAGHQLQTEYYALLSNGLSAHCLDTAFDSAIAQYLLEPTRSKYELKTILFDYAQQEIPDEKEFLSKNGQMDLFSDQIKKYQEYGAKWCAAVACIEQIIKEKLSAEELNEVFYEIELPLITVLASMEYQGMAIHKETLLETSGHISGQIQELTDKIHELAGEVFNINSPKQLGVILFEKLQLKGAKKTKTGYATGADILERLLEEHPIIPLILEYRMLTKLNSTYIEGILPLIDSKGKLHAHFQQTVTATGRISCTEPNLQNIPIRQELGRKLRKAFVPESDAFTLVGADYSQIELRVLAHMSEDPTLIEAFNEGDDIHRITAAKVFGVAEEDVTSLQRSNAKAVNFGVIYGMSGFGLSSNLNISRKEAEKYIDEYFKKYTRVKTFMDEQVALCKENGYVTTIKNRRRNIPEINASNYMVRQSGERLAMNSPIQGSAADIIKIAMIKVHNELINKQMKSSLILQVHDELILQAHKDELEQVKQLLAENMENAVKMHVVLSVDLNTGDNWYDLK
ncbi:DNA polymerase I [Sinanaerobacter sp. ZZT-01]|uniref:DNA polymerase I n=1 Tax=Sinanaerobacter sp. ZZT-01 TaxID=3111540 RepID=UPI002D78D3A1|nr:DNA polymerase I [Sinanaerobacter sp. ZZT-01]WRR93200.1 DNA polymerase I [Sinanaerobacter sp. ZZT-01]